MIERGMMRLLHDMFPEDGYDKIVKDLDFRIQMLDHVESESHDESPKSDSSGTDRDV